MKQDCDLTIKIGQDARGRRKWFWVRFRKGRFSFPIWPCDRLGRSRQPLGHSIFVKSSGSALFLRLAVSDSGRAFDLDRAKRGEENWIGHHASAYVSDTNRSSRGSRHAAVNAFHGAHGTPSSSTTFGVEGLFRMVSSLDGRSSAKKHDSDRLAGAGRHPIGSKTMREKTRSMWLIITLAMNVSVKAMSQEQLRTLVVSGHAGSVPVTQMNGKNYVEVEALAQVANGTLSFNGNQITLTLSTASGNATAASPGPNKGFSKEFLRAGIEAMSTLREWHSVLASAIENQYPFTLAGLASYQGPAMKNLRLAQVAATTEADQNAVQLIASAHQKMKQLSDKYIAQRAEATSIPPDALKDDSLDQTLIACGKSLGAMAAGGQFVDDGTCN